MQLLKTIGIKKNNIKYRKRDAARAIVLDDIGRLALLFVSKKNYHKLPGGGLEDGENTKKALEREIREETGAKAQIIEQVGQIEEFRKTRDQHGDFLHQISYCYIAQEVGNRKSPEFTEKEKSDGFELMWVELDEAIELLENDNPPDLNHKSIVERDLVFLHEAKRIIEN